MFSTNHMQTITECKMDKEARENMWNLVNILILITLNPRKT